MAPEWNAGYTTEIDYTYGYYRELCPALLRFALLVQGYALPEPSSDFSYLELGMGQGVTSAIHSVANAGEFWGTDFNPRHAAHAASLVDDTGANTVFLDDSFEELATRLAAMPSPPRFDMIVLHGIWSWISPENRDFIRQIIRENLKPNGVAYVSYNCLPGWGAALPLRNLLKAHGDYMSAPDTGLIAKVDAALAFANRLVEAKTGYFEQNPAIKKRLERVSSQNKSYVGHEYFNEHFYPMTVAEAVEMLQEAKLEFAASANVLDSVDAINLSAEAQKIMSEVNNPVMRETLRDYFMNQQFRRDIYVRGARRVSGPQRMKMMGDMRFVLTTNAKDVPMKVKGGMGEANLQEAIYRPIVEKFAEAGAKSLSVRDLLDDERLKGNASGALMQAVTILVGAGHIHPAKGTRQIEAAAQACDHFNRAVIERSKLENTVTTLASPVTGGGVSVGRFEQLFLGSVRAGKSDPRKWVERAWAILSKQGQRLVKDGKALEGADENLAQLTEQANTFAEKRLPILKNLRIAS